MFEVVGVVLFVVSLAGFFFSLRMLACNDRTRDERRALLYSISVSDPLFPELMAAFGAVSYDRHLWTMAFFLDPRRLYPASIQHLWREVP